MTSQFNNFDNVSIQFTSIFLQFFLKNLHKLIYYDEIIRNNLFSFIKSDNLPRNHEMTVK